MYPTVDSPQSLIVADFNGDHKLDLAVGGSGVSVLLGNGDGTFQKQLVSPGGSPLAAADFNLDGKLDLFAGGDILLGKGDGTFVLNATYPNGVAAAAADLNGDGKPDLVIAQGGGNLSADSVSVLLGNGDGTFQTAAQYGTAPYPAYVVIADFNGDGKFDLALADPDCDVYNFNCSTPGAVSILLGFGDGTFVGGKDYSCASIPSQIISADFNGGGKPDIAAETAFAPNGGPPPIGVYLGNGDGTFQPEVATSLTQAAGGIAAGDFNGDGRADLATVFSNCVNNNCLPGDAVVLIGNGDGTFQPPVEYTVGLQPEYLAVGDFDGDGKPDLAVSNSGANTVSILLNNGDGTFQPHVDYPAGTNPGWVVVGDFKGDGILDLAVVDYGANTVSILLGNGDGTFTPGTPVALGAQPQAIVATDFNSDGKLDLAVTTTTSNQVFILLGNGYGTFQPPVGYPDGTNFGLLSVGDFNSDGKPDLVVGGEFAYIAAILLGNGDGTFQPPIFNFLEQGPIAVADFNEDGSPDTAGGTGYGFPSSTVSVMLSVAFKAVSPASLNFGSQGVGTTSAAQTITISNSSNVSFNIASIVASGNFSQTNDCGASLVPGAHCAVTVSFTPTATGLESGAITVTDSTKISPLAIPLSGTGVNGPFLTPYPSRTSFAPQAVGTSSTPAVIMLLNTGNASLNINSISITGADSSDFMQNNKCGSSLPAAGRCNVNVTFTPKAAGSRTASLAVSDTAPGSPQTVALSGVGVAAPDFSVAAAPGSPTSQTISAGQSAKFSLVVTPSGSFTGTVNLSCSISPSVTPAPTCGLPSSVQVTAGQAAPVTVTVGTTAPVTTGTVTDVDFPAGWMPLAWTGMLLGSGWVLLRNRKRLPILAAPLVVLALGLWVGCGGGSGSSSHTTPGTPAGTYTATITATSSSLNHNMALTIVVQ